MKMEKLIGLSATVLLFCAFTFSACDLFSSPTDDYSCSIPSELTGRTLKFKHKNNPYSWVTEWWYQFYPDGSRYAAVGCNSRNSFGASRWHTLSGIVFRREHICTLSVVSAFSCPKLSGSDSMLEHLWRLSVVSALR